jgi:hypothetical protein
VSEAHLAFGPQMLHFRQHVREDASTTIDGLECEGHMVQVSRVVDQALIFRGGDRTAPFSRCLQGKPLRFHARAIASVVRMVGAQKVVFKYHGVLTVPARFVEHGLSADEVWSMIANLVDLAETGEDAAMVLVLGREMKLHHIGHEVGVARLRLLVRAEVADLLDTQRGARWVPFFAPEDHKDQVGDLAPLVVVLIHEIAVHQTLTHLQLVFHKLHEGSLSLVLPLMPFPPLDITIEFTLAPFVLGSQTRIGGAKCFSQTLNLLQLQFPQRSVVVQGAFVLVHYPSVLHTLLLQGGPHTANWRNEEVIQTLSSILGTPAVPGGDGLDPWWRRRCGVATRGFTNSTNSTLVVVYGGEVRSSSGTTTIFVRSDTGLASIFVRSSRPRVTRGKTLI